MISISQKTEQRLWLLAAAVCAVVAVLLLGGCAGWSDYASEVRVVNAQIAVDKKAERDQAGREDQGIGAALAAPGLSNEARIAIAGFWALSRARGGSVGQGPGYVAPMPPTDPWDTFLKAAAIIVPTAGTVAVANQNAKTARVQSDNAARVAESTNAAFLGLGTAGVNGIRDVALEQARQAPNLRPSVTFTIGRDGVIGSGTLQSLTTGADGVLGSGTITKPSPRICTVGATGTVSCSP